MNPTVGVDIVDLDALRAWRRAPEHVNPSMAARRKVLDSGRTVLCWMPPVPGEPQRFAWVCPGCGRLGGGYLTGGDLPDGGGRSWALTGELDAPHLTPELECPGWQTGACGTRWWMRGDHLEPA